MMLPLTRAHGIARHWIEWFRLLFSLNWRAKHRQNIP